MPQGKKHQRQSQDNLASWLNLKMFYRTAAPSLLTPSVSSSGGREVAAEKLVPYSSSIELELQRTRHTFSATNFSYFGKQASKMPDSTIHSFLSLKVLILYFFKTWD